MKTILDTDVQERRAKSDLAVDGGQCVRTRKFARWPSLSEDEVDAASVVLRSGKLNHWTGEAVRQFENEFASFAGCRHGIAVANGTVALELAFYSLRIGPGDEVIVPSLTFVASASCVIMRGAKPVFADVSHHTAFAARGHDFVLAKGETYKQQTSSGFRWLHYTFGTNWRLTEMQAAIGRSLIAKLPAQLEIRSRNANIFESALWQSPCAPSYGSAARDRPCVLQILWVHRLELMRKAWNRDQLLQAIAAEGIPCFSGSCSEIYLDGWRDASNKVGHLRRAQ